MHIKTNFYRAELANFTKLQDRLKHSSELLTDVSDKAVIELGQEWSHVGVFVAGSLGRLETGRKSDLDLFLLGKGQTNVSKRRFSKLQEIQLLSKLIQINRSAGLPEFSGDGRYLKIHDLSDLIDSTGDANDDSENYFTARMLLLLESKPLWNAELRREAIDAVLENYFKDGKGKKDFRPLFLLNDILRYWRTVCLNYERDRISPNDKWWKKNLNLKFSRKLTVFSTVLAVVTKAVETKADISALTEEVPLNRLAIALDSLGTDAFLPEFQQALIDYESFLAAKSHNEVEQPSEASKKEFSEKAERFGDLFVKVLMSQAIDQGLRKFLLV
jgi:hypothetical protein